jgi:mono/diheme cytochrome c family protein
MLMFPRFIPATLAAGAVFLSGSSVIADTQAGRLLAERSCTACHALDTQPSGSDAAPSFARLAATNRESPGWVRAWLTEPHPPMAGINLTRQEIEDIVAYLETLAATKP